MDPTEDSAAAATEAPLPTEPPYELLPGLPEGTDLEALDDFVFSCREQLEQGLYERMYGDELFDEYHIPLGEGGILFVVNNGKHNYDRYDFNGVIPESCAYVPDELSVEDLCWDPEECGTLFYFYPEQDDYAYHYDNGTNGYGMKTMLCVIYPKEQQVWGPSCVYFSSPPSRVSGAGVGHDTIASYNFKTAIQAVYRYAGIPAATFIETDHGTFSFKVDPYSYDNYYIYLYEQEGRESGLPIDEFLESVGLLPEDCRRQTIWSDLDGLVIQGENATLTLHGTRSGELMTATYTDASGSQEYQVYGAYCDSIVVIGDSYITLN